MRRCRAFSKDEADRLCGVIRFARIDRASLLGQKIVHLLGQSHRLAEFRHTLLRVFADVVPPAGVSSQLVQLLSVYHDFR